MFSRRTMLGPSTGAFHTPVCTARPCQATSCGRPTLTDINRPASGRGDSAAEHASYGVGAVLDYPQSGERFRGRDTIQEQRSGHPADRHFTIRRITGSGNLWVSECTITYDGVASFSVSIMEFTGDQVSHESQYFGDPFEAAPW